MQHSMNCPNKDSVVFNSAGCIEGCPQSEERIAGIDYDIPGLTDEDHGELVIDDDGGASFEYPNGDW